MIWGQALSSTLHVHTFSSTGVHISQPFFFLYFRTTTLLLMTGVKEDFLLPVGYMMMTLVRLAIIPSWWLFISCLFSLAHTARVTLTSPASNDSTLWKFPFDFDPGSIPPPGCNSGMKKKHLLIFFCTENVGNETSRKKECWKGMQGVWRNWWTST